MMSLTLNLLTTTIVALLSNARKWQMGFNPAFKGLNSTLFAIVTFAHLSLISTMEGTLLEKKFLYKCLDLVRYFLTNGT
jgi:hypothetical protein